MGDVRDTGNGIHIDADALESGGNNNMLEDWNKLQRVRAGTLCLQQHMKIAGRKKEKQKQLLNI
ncbi:hypothetical protein HYS99_00760 [Candidatus Giovannonibacteria bacterium]|nr:hypothetical protein [Candidatus Giovannonibacteria bacterium]